MAENEISTQAPATEAVEPIYLDETAKDNGRKLDQMTAALLGMSSSLGVIARAQTGVVEEMGYNGIKAVVAFPGGHPACQHLHRQGRQSLRLPVGRGKDGRYRRG